MGGGEQTRDFIHINDVVDATIEAVKQDVQGPVNLGLGVPTSFNKLAEMVAKECGYSPEYRHINDAPEGVHFRVSNPTKMFEFYSPKITLEEGIKMSLDKLK